MGHLSADELKEDGNNYLILHPGASIAEEFESKDWSNYDVSLFAEGYYVPFSFYQAQTFAQE